MPRGYITLWAISILFACFARSTPASADTAAEPDCFDALIYASIVHQTPTVMPDCGDDCIIMSWPWVLELDVERVSKGNIALGPLTVLTVQHTDYRTDLGARRWWLRRNSLGLFNVLRLSEKTEIPHCAKDAQPARPYIKPADGKTLRDLVKEGEEYYGRHP